MALGLFCSSKLCHFVIELQRGEKNEKGRVAGSLIRGIIGILDSFTNQRGGYFLFVCILRLYALYQNNNACFLLRFMENTATLNHSL